MNKYLNSFFINFLLIIFIISIPNFNAANELLIYADSISYDKDENIIASGNAKVFQKILSFFQI